MNLNNVLKIGFADSSQAFLRHRNEDSTAFKLYENGFDVWMINARGNVHSRKHTHLNCSDSKFWDFSWHEIGLYDIPATVDYILKNTHQKKLAYIGVSQGAAVILVTLSELPQYNDKISITIMMAPAIIFEHMHNNFFPRTNEFIKMLHFLGVSASNGYQFLAFKLRNLM